MPKTNIAMESLAAEIDAFAAIRTGVVAVEKGGGAKHSENDG